MTKTDNNLKKYLNDFFDNIELYDDIKNNCDYKNTLKTYIDTFLEQQTTKSAYEIYETFFMIYQIINEDKSEHTIITPNEPNTLLELVSLMKKYEENTGDLIDKQRDHFIHSVNVFLLGLSIYSQNEKYQKYFKDYVRNSPYEKYYRFKNNEVTNEEFLYRWGIASLFHDIGYPVEIIGKQMKNFINNSVKSIDDSYNVNPGIDFKDFNEFNSIVKQKSDFADKFRESYTHAKFLNMFKPTDIMACKIYEDFKDELELKSITRNLDNFVNTMGEQGFIDHGFFSSILVLNSYGYLIQNYEKKYSFFFYPIVDSATAILLHNYYRNTLQAEPFNLGRLSPAKSPISFLLILCDELQEWNRRPWGLQDRLKNHVDDVITDITPDSLYIKYIVKTGTMGNKFLTSKKELFDKVLDIESIFKDGIFLKTNIEKDNIMKELIYTEVDSADPLLKLTSNLPRYLYEAYAKYYGEPNPKPFDELEPQEKYSNIRQAKSISKNLKIIGCKLALKNDKHEEYTPSDRELKDLGMYEHKDWYCEKITAGWSPGDKKDEVNLINPHLVSWEKLDDNARQFNIDTYRNLPYILEPIGLKIIINNTRLITAELHEYYNEVYNDNNPFDDLDIDDKYFNYTQTGQMIKALNKKGYEIVPIDYAAEAVTEFSPEELEFLAKNEHEQWCEYKSELGWTYADEKSNENKTNPKLLEWEALDEETRQFNINTYKNLPRLCSSERVGLKIVKA